MTTSRTAERSRRLEPVSARGKVAQVTTGACILLASSLTIWSAWAELTCPYGGPAGREFCRTTVGVGGLFVMAGIATALFGAVVLWGGIWRPIDPQGGHGWTWGEGALVALAGGVLGLLVIDSTVCPDGYRKATGFALCILRSDPAVRVEATSQVAFQAGVVLAGVGLGIVIGAWRRLPSAVGAVIAALATVAGTVWFIEDTVGLPW